MALYNALVELIGEPPSGYDIVVWVVCVFILIFLLSNAFGILSAFLNFLLGKR